jgi:hypothetical protein
MCDSMPESGKFVPPNLKRARGGEERQLRGDGSPVMTNRQSLYLSFETFFELIESPCLLWEWYV